MRVECFNPEEVNVMDKGKAYEENFDAQFDAQLRESSPEFALPGARKDPARPETKIEYYKRIQAARAAARKQPK